MEASQYRVIVPSPVVVPVEAELFLFLFSVVGVFVVGRSFFLNACEVKTERILYLLLLFKSLFLSCLHKKNPTDYGRAFFL